MNTLNLSAFIRPGVAVAAAGVALSIAATPAVAASPYNIKTTVQYQNMRTYVDVLSAKKDTPATSAAIQKYTIKLDTHADRSKNKARTLYQHQLFNAKTVRKADKAHIASIERTENKQVNALVQSRKTHVATLRADEQNAEDAITSRYNKQSAPVVKALKKTRKQLASTTDPVERASLKLQIDNYTNELADFNQARNTAISLSDDHYNELVSSTKRDYKQRIVQTRHDYDVQITAAQEQMQSRYTTSVDNARARRADNFAAVDALHHTGAGYIASMPVQS